MKKIIAIILAIIGIILISKIIISMFQAPAIMIIGGADGVTSIYVSDRNTFQFLLGACCLVISVVLFFLKRK